MCQEGALSGGREGVLLGAGMVKRVRGVAYSMRVAPAASNRMVDGARGVLNSLLADVFVFTDHMPGHEAGASPGYGLSLVAETTTGLLISAQASAPPAVKVWICGTCRGSADIHSLSKVHAHSAMLMASCHCDVCFRDLL